MISEPALVTDLDGTLVRTDTLYESLCVALKRNLALLFLLPFWLLKGKAYLKRELVAAGKPDMTLLPYRRSVIGLLNDERARGRKIVLCTAADRSIADGVQEHLQLFDEVIASDGIRNLKGDAKRDELVARYGEGGFEYIGDNVADVPVWDAASAVTVVAPGPRFKLFVQRRYPTARILDDERSSLKTWFKAVRVHQWVKNFLVWLPLVMAHEIFDAAKILHVFLAFAAFSLCASSVYLLNDLFDLESDRQHAIKSHRAFASGLLPIRAGLLMFPAMLLGAALVTLVLPADFAWVLAIYYLTTIAYSVRFKQIMMLDIVVLAMLYTLRIVAGGAAARVVVSEWLLAFSMFFFLSLACVKRYSELFRLKRAERKGETTARGRGYTVEDLEQIASLGSSSGYISILVLALYVSSVEVLGLYRAPRFLWLVCPLLLYWLGRLWLLTHRGKIHEDPIVFALRDRTSYLVGVLAVILIVLAALGVQSA